jgi:hypothetical protein
MSEFPPIGDMPHVNGTTATVYRQSGMWRGHPLAGWWKRMTAALINYGGPAVAAKIVSPLFDYPFVGKYLFGSGLLFVMWFVLVLEMIGVNEKNFDVGKSLLGITTVRPVWTPDGRPAFAEVSNEWRLARLIAHLLDLPFIIGPMVVGLRWNRRSIADAIAGTVVLNVRRSQLNLEPPMLNGSYLPRDNG